ncbi:hypothetical protein EYF80_007890 [Liparis tanakae]|uniref:Uncharacterized protein n=1 Tax=Liparis tanakae TaxID=230148 RepID=A0A4Z2IVA6_9TELE|nr:hypothetical protein EYF80_007890 [Liparis tanakae]
MLRGRIGVHLPASRRPLTPSYRAFGVHQQQMFGDCSASRRLILPWYHVWPSSSSCARSAAERTRRGLALSTDAALWRPDTWAGAGPGGGGWDRHWMASSKGSGVEK